MSDKATKYADQLMVAYNELHSASRQLDRKIARIESELLELKDVLFCINQTLKDIETNTFENEKFNNPDKP